MADPQPLVAVIILNWNGYEDTVNCIHSILKATFSHLKICLVDNGSQNNEAERLHQLFSPSVHVIVNQKNEGFAGGNNTGFRAALSDQRVAYILAINNDLIVEPQTIGSMVAVAERDQNIGMVASRMMNYYHRDRVDNLGLFLSSAGLGFNRKTDRYPLFCPSGGCALYKASALREILSVSNEIFDEDFFAYVEDLDLGFRLRLMGYRAAYADNAVAYHKEGVSSGGATSDFSIFHGQRNNLWFVIKNFPRRMLLKNFVWIVGTQIGALALYAKRKKLWLLLKAKWAALRGMKTMLRKRTLVQRSMTLPASALETVMTKPSIVRPES